MSVVGAIGIDLWVALLNRIFVHLVIVVRRTTQRKELLVAAALEGVRGVVGLGEPWARTGEPRCQRTLRITAGGFRRTRCRSGEPSQRHREHPAPEIHNERFVAHPPRHRRAERIRPVMALAPSADESKNTLARVRPPRGPVALRRRVLRHRSPAIG